MSEPVEVSVTKAVRKMDVSPGGHKASFEVTGACYDSFSVAGGGKGRVLGALMRSVLR